MSDRELLELAAKAVGLSNFEYVEDGEGCYFDCGYDGPMTGLSIKYEYRIWNPLDDDGDSLRLAVKLGLNVIYHETVRIVDCNGQFESLDSTLYNTDPYAATRRAIVRAAAEVGRSM